MRQLDLFPPSKTTQAFLNARAAYKIARQLHRIGMIDLGQLWARRSDYLVALYALRAERGQS